MDGSYEMNMGIRGGSLLAGLTERAGVDEVGRVRCEIRVVYL